VLKSEDEEGRYRKVLSIHISVGVREALPKEEREREKRQTRESYACYWQLFQQPDFLWLSYFVPAYIIFFVG